MNEEMKTNQETEILEVDQFNWIIPECCRELWDSCPHVVHKEKTKKKNIGM